ncbi:Ribose/xylose/arabinose/galactoside ABC-type transport system, permease component [Micromonospora viridifaciens]|uniref:Ribose/xylose/arabinose/galactoside ABC-type transport system, permease component n=1 Tax=Micromonospora viridifaciens TaxID=1881 RepID=A0A1C4UP76_MICVI|nr:ABC transporter permease [Micromonospora viridifaciens]SCE73533.1 Ribose/xylose/arabinose/galactoside ABC-type transport system, permease component [Micromonospora viridifaciens]
MAYDETGRNAPVEPSSGVPAAVLENVFDDPSHGEPGRDRIAVHVVWEFLLLAGLAAVTWRLWQDSADALRGEGLRSLLVNVAGLGLLALAAGLSLRAAAVNLAIGPVGLAAALHFAEQGDRGLREALLPALVVAALGGLALALAVVVLHVPGWAASLAGAAGVIVYIERRTGPVLVQGGGYDPRPNALYFFVGFAAVAVLGGLFGAMRPIRRLVGRFRPVADPARRRGGVAATVTGLALIGSTVLAMLGGLLLAANRSGPLTPATGLDWSVLAVGTATLAGTSAYGRRGGVFGTLFAVSLVAVFLTWAGARGWTISRWALGGAVLGVGLLVTRLVEAFGRPRAAGADAEVLPSGDGTISTGWTLTRPPEPADTWPSVLPLRPSDTPVETWEAPRWESEPRRWDADDR